MKSLLEFAMVMEEAPDSETKQNLHTNHYRCLACQWMVPSCQSTSSLKYHIKGSSDVQHCPSVTLYMQRRLNEIEGVNEAIQDMETSASDFIKKSKKRKLQAVDLPIPMDSIALVPILTGLESTTFKILCQLVNVTDFTARKLVEINSHQGNLISELSSMCCKAMSTLPARAMNARCLWGVDELQVNSGLMFSLLPLLPDAACQQVLEQDKLVSELRSQCMMAAVASSSQTKMASFSEYANVCPEYSDSSTGHHTADSGSSATSTRKPMHWHC